MDELLLKIYENVIRYEGETIRMEERVTEEVDRLTTQYKEQITNEELEELQDLLFSIALSAEHEGFKLGMKFFAKLLAECLS